MLRFAAAMSPRSLLAPVASLPALAFRPLTLMSELIEAFRMLPAIAENTASMAAALEALPRIEEQLAAVEKGVSVLPEVDQQMHRMLRSMEILRAEVEGVGAAVMPLQDTALSVGRLVGRLPGGGRRAKVVQVEIAPEEDSPAEAEPRP